MDYFPVPSVSRAGVDVHFVARGEVPTQDDWSSFPKRTLLCDIDGKLTQTLSAYRVAGLLQAWGFFGMIQILLGQPIVLRDWSRRGDPAGRTQFVKWPSASVNQFLRLRKRQDESERRFESEAFAEVVRVCIEVENSKYALLSPVAEVALSVRMLCESACAIIEDAQIQTLYVENKYLERRMLARHWCPSIVDDLLRRQVSGLLAAYYLFCMQRSSQQGVEHTECSKEVCCAYNIPKGVSYKTRHVTKDCQCGQDGIGVDPKVLARIVARGGVPLVNVVEKNGKMTLKLSEASVTTEFCAISHVWKDGLGNFEANTLPKCQLQRIHRCLENLPERPRTTATIGVFTLFPGVRVDASRYQLILGKPGKHKEFKFWMDSLCIPAGQGEEVKRLKFLAINRMNLIYATANRVLVLDESMKDARASVSNMIEMHARIFVSPWMRRSWTLQEGSLAHFCQFQCADAVVTPAWHGQVKDLRNNRKTDDENTQWAPRSIHPRTLTVDKRFKVAWRKRLNEWLFDFGYRERIPEEPHEMSLTAPVRPEDNELENWMFLTFTKMVSGAFRPFFNDEYDAEVELEKVAPFYDDDFANTKTGRFVAVWNELTRRSTTEPDDVYLIFSNLLNFSTRKVAQVPVQQRLQSMVWSSEIQPVGLLYNRGKRLNDHENHLNRWVPAELSRFKIDTQDKMRFHKGRLWIQSESTADATIFLFKNTVRRCNEFYLQGDIGDPLDVRFTAYQRDDDKFVHTEFQGICILSAEYPSMNEKAPSPAARFYVKERYEWSRDQPEPEGMTPWEGLGEHYWITKKVKGTNVRLLLVYDCPVTITYVPSQPLSDDAVVIAEEDQYDWMFCSNTDRAWKIEVECDMSQDVERLTYVRGAAQDGECLRKLLERLDWWYTVATLAYLLAALPLRIKIAVDIGWRGTTALYKASTIIFAFTIFTPIHESLFIADRVRQHAVRPIDVAYVVISLSSIWLTVVVLYLTMLLIAFFRYRGWVKSFDQEWQETRPPRWTARLSRLTSPLHAVFSGTLNLTRNLRLRLGIASRPSTPPEADAHSDSGSSSELKDVPCDGCSDAIDGVYYRCSQCDQGNYYLCKSCVDTGTRCDDVGHWLTRHSLLLDEWELVEIAPNKTVAVKYRKQRKKDAKYKLMLGHKSLYLSMGLGEENIVIWDIEDPDTMYRQKLGRTRVAEVSGAE